MPRRNHVRQTFWQKLHRSVEDNPNVVSFYSNLISSLLTLSALIATVYFSVTTLQNAGQQLTEAGQQLKLAQQQFIYSKKQHSEDSLASIQKDLLLDQRFVDDTVKQNRREAYQEIRNRNQDEANKQQFVLNREQLKAIQLQAKTAESQLNQQLDQYKQQLYEQRPVFIIDSSHVVSVNSVKSTIQFTFSNKGFRSAHVDSVILAFDNEAKNCFSVTNNPGGFDAVNNHQSTLLTTPINIYNACLNDKKTIYYLLIYYKDKASGNSQIEPIFFIWNLLPNKQFGYQRVTNEYLTEFKKRLKRKSIFYID